MDAALGVLQPYQQHTESATEGAGTRILRSPATVAVTVFAAYSLWISLLLLRGYDPRQSIHFGSSFVSRPHAQELMHIDPRSPLVRAGFGSDGEFYYFIAVHPLQARSFMDDPAYRYKRILYPMAARALALGRWQLIPYTLILINLLALGAGTLALAAWLKRNSLSVWLALIYGFYPGLALAFQRNYTEPLAYALMAIGVYLYSFGGKRQLVASPLCFALASLTRDKMVAFAVFFFAGILLADLEGRDPGRWVRQVTRRMPGAVLFGAIALLPALAYEAFLKLWLHTLPAATGQVGAPLAGPASMHPGDASLYLALVSVVFPSAVLTGTGLWALWRGAWRFEIVALLVTIQLSVVFARPEYWTDVPGGVMRVSIAVILLALYCIPAFDGVTGPKRWWLRASAGGWLFLVPAIALFGIVVIAKSIL